MTTHPLLSEQLAQQVAEIAALQVAELAGAVPPAYLLDRHTGLRLTQEANDLCFGKVLFFKISLLSGTGLQSVALLKIGWTSKARLLGH